MSQTNTSDALAYVAHTFAEAYYGLLVDPENFANLHTFYKLDAVFTRGDEAKGQTDASTTSGLEAIKKELATFHNEVRNCEVNLTVMDSQYSVNQGIVITAIGSFDRLESGSVKSRRFVQTFFLEAQTPNNYSIRNEMLRYLNDSPKKAVVAKEEPKPQPVAATTTPATNGTEAHSTPVTPAVESNGDGAKKQPQEKKKSTAAGSPTTGRKSDRRQNRKGEDKPRRDTKSEEQTQSKPAKPATWANVVSGNSVTVGTAPAAEQTKPKAASKQQAQAAQQQGQQQGQQQSQQPKPLKEKKPKQERETSLSLYVGNLPFEATPEQVYNLFIKYGTLKEVVLKRGYGFIEFNSAEDLKKVLDAFTANPVELDGRLLTVEDRKRGERSGGAKPNGRSQVKPAAAKRGGKTGGRANDNAAH